MMETYIGKTISDFTLQSSDGQTISLSPNPPKDTAGRREDSGGGVRELQEGR